MVGTEVCCWWMGALEGRELRMAVRPHSAVGTQAGLLAHRSKAFGVWCALSKAQRLSAVSRSLAGGVLGWPAEGMSGGIGRLGQRGPGLLPTDIPPIHLG